MMLKARMSDPYLCAFHLNVAVLLNAYGYFSFQEMNHELAARLRQQTF